jgi:hypothetical protein
MPPETALERNILHPAIARGLGSVAFPLIGCGVFCLDEKMPIEQFLDAVEIIDSRLDATKQLDVWLAIRNRDQFESAVGKILGLLLSARQQMITAQLNPALFQSSTTLSRIGSAGASATVGRNSSPDLSR